MVDGGIGKDGYRLYYPMGVDSAPVVVFLHGYGGYNPMYYGGWIRHLVACGRTVVFPYYQDNFLSPSPEHFANHAAGAIRKAMDMLQRTEGLPSPAGQALDYIGHSFGGAIAADLATRTDELDLPPSGVVFLAMPGTGPFRKGRLEDYGGIPDSTILAIVVGNSDRVVGEEFGRLVWTTALRTSRKLWMALEDRPGKPRLRGGHNVPCSRDLAFDNGVRNYNFAKTILSGGTDAYDQLLWQTFDRLQYTASQGGWLDDGEVRDLRVLQQESLDAEHVGIFTSSPVAPKESSGG
jgi:pimeloyl-ACP methyl ester carboxylesterase